MSQLKWQRNRPLPLRRQGMQQSLIGMASHPASASGSQNIAYVCMGKVRNGTNRWSLRMTQTYRLLIILWDNAKNIRLWHTQGSAKQHNRLIEGKEKTTTLQRGLCNTFGQWSGLTKVTSWSVEGSRCTAQCVGRLPVYWADVRATCIATILCYQVVYASIPLHKSY